jgi:hypothetical protein
MTRSRSLGCASAGWSFASETSRSARRTWPRSSRPTLEGTCAAQGRVSLHPCARRIARSERPLCTACASPPVAQWTSPPVARARGGAGEGLEGEVGPIRRLEVPDRRSPGPGPGPGPPHLEAHLGEHAHDRHEQVIGFVCGRRFNQLQRYARVHDRRALHRRTTGHRVEAAVVGATKLGRERGVALRPGSRDVLGQRLEPDCTLVDVESAAVRARGRSKSKSRSRTQRSSVNAYPPRSSPALRASTLSPSALRPRYRAYLR